MPIIRLKRGTAANIEAATLQVGEPAFATDTDELYIGTATGKVKLAKSPHGNEAHSPDFLAVDGSNSPTADLDMGQVLLKGLDGLFGWQAPDHAYVNHPLLTNLLAFADKKYTVTVSPAPTEGAISSVFDTPLTNAAKWGQTITPPIEITVDLGTSISWVTDIGIGFWPGEYPSSVKIEYWSTSAGQWQTLLDTSSNSSLLIVLRGSSHWDYVGKLRFTLSGFVGSKITVTTIFAHSAHDQAFPFGHVLYIDGGKMYGDIDMNSNKITNLADPTAAQDAATKNYADGKLPLNTSSAIDAYMSGNKWLSVATSGIVGLPKQSCVISYMDNGGTNLTLSASTWTVVPYDTELKDTQGEFDPSTHRFTASEDGIYYFNARAHLTDLPDQQYARMLAFKNGAVLYPEVFVTQSGIYDTTVVLEGLLDLSAGDYVEWQIWAHAACDVVYGARNTILYICKVA